MISLVVMGLLLCTSFALADGEGRAVYRDVSRSVPALESVDRTGSCAVSLFWNAATAGFFGWDDFDAMSVYLDPTIDADTTCSAPFYPFQITSVDLLFTPGSDSTGIGQTVTFRVDIQCPKDLASGSVTDACQGPGPAVCSVIATYTLTQADYDLGLFFVNVPIECCVDRPFFVTSAFVSYTGLYYEAPGPVFQRDALIVGQECRAWSHFDLGLGYCTLANAFDYGCSPAPCFPGPWGIYANGNAGVQCTPVTNCVALANNYPGDDASDPLMITSRHPPFNEFVVNLCDYTSDYDHRLDSPTANPNARRFGGRAPDVVLGVAFDTALPEACFAITLTPMCPPDFSYFRLRTWLEDGVGYLTDGNPPYPTFLAPQTYDLTATGIGCQPWNGDPYPFRFLIFVDAQPGCCCPIQVTYSGDRPLPVELSSFQAVAGNGQVTLTWVTASESNMDFFQIMRNGAALTEVVASNNAAGHTYTFVDNRVVNGTTYQYQLSAQDIGGAVTIFPRIEAATPMPMANVVTEYALSQNYPNPFNPSTEIVFDMKDAGFVTLKVYNLLGQEIKALVNGNMSAGRHNVTFDATGLPSGLYVYKMETTGFSAQSKMLLMK
jgi:hypothetical protein